MKYLVGVDEAGRGPLAGPVAVGIAVVPIDFDWSLIPGVDDSKKLSPKRREEVFEIATGLRNDQVLNFAVSQTNAALIDKYGIVSGIKRAMLNCFNNLALNPEDCLVLLDGSLRAPDIYKQQKTIIKGDALEPIIGLASIAAKVTRDAHMIRLANKPDLCRYKFHIHKGYGTKLHSELIRQHGLSDIHRRSFCRAFQT